jgi:hypothetical protein
MPMIGDGRENCEKLSVSVEELARVEGGLSLLTPAFNFDINETRTLLIRPFTPLAKPMTTVVPRPPG